MTTQPIIDIVTSPPTGEASCYLAVYSYGAEYGVMLRIKPKRRVARYITLDIASAEGLAAALQTVSTGLRATP